MSSRTRPLTLLAVLTALATLAAGLLAVRPAQATHDTATRRVGGDTRYATAAELAAATFPDGAETVVLARGDEFADGLAAAPLARGAGAPVLLTRPDELPDPTRDALAELETAEVYLLGGTDAISAEVEDHLDDEYTVRRLAGESRFGTAAAVAREAAELAGVGTLAGSRVAFVVDGHGFADGLAVGPVAASGAGPFPVLPVAPDTYPSATEAALAELDVETVFVVGGTDAVSEHVEAHLEEDVGSVVRLAGEDRLATAVEVADFALSELGYEGDRITLARGDGFADALAAGLPAARHDAPLLLTADPDTLGTPAATWLGDACPVAGTVRAVGGTDAVSADVLTRAAEAAAGCHDGDETSQTWLVAPQQPRSGAPGDEHEFTVAGRYDDRPLVEPLDVALAPCERVDLDGVVTFSDDDGDGFADGIGATDTDRARLTRASEAERVERAYAHDAHFLHGQLSFAVASDGADCTVPVVFRDAEDDDRLPVDGAGHPLEHFGVGRASWE